MKRVYIFFFLFFAACAIWAVMPLLGRGYIPTHDGEYHIIRIVEFSKMLGAGYLFPRWAPDLNSGYGIPIFSYHYPLPNYVGSLIRVITGDAVYAFQQSMAFSYVAIGVGAFLWLTALFGTFPALAGAIVAVFVPYVFVDMYVRGSVGELWAIAFLFLTLASIERKHKVGVAISVALLVLSHNILAMLFGAFIIAYGMIRNRKILPWMLGGVGLSAFFWLPAIVESRFVQGLNTVNFREHFVQVYELLIPSWGTQFSGSGSIGNKISFQLGIIPLMVVIGSFFAVRKRSRLATFLYIVLLGCIFFMLPISKPLWDIITPLQLIQYPWRLLSFVVPIAGFFAAYWVSSMKVRWWGIVIAALAVLFSASYARPVVYAPRNEAYYMSRPNFTQGTSSMGNSFSTIWTGWKETPSPMPYTGTYLDRHYQITKTSTSDTKIPILYFPGWRVSVDGNEVPIEYTKDGVIQVDVPAGDHKIRAYFTETPVRLAADIVSAVSLVILLAWAILAL